MNQKFTQISQLPLATLPLTGAEVVPMSQAGVTVQAPSLAVAILGASGSGGALSLAQRIALARSLGQFTVLASGAPGIASPVAAGLWPLVTIVVPGNAMGQNGILRVSSMWSLSEHATHQKGGSLYLGALKVSSVFNFVDAVFCNTTLHTSCSVITNKGATNVQRQSSIMASGPSSVTPSTKPGVALANPGNGSSLSDTVDTTVDWNLILAGQKVTAAETLILESYLVEILPT